MARLQSLELDGQTWSLPMPRICVVDAKRSKSVVGWHSPNRWHQGAVSLSEVVLTPDAVGHGVFRAIEVLAHEFLHLANAASDRADTSRGGRYHNKLFQETATVLGMVVAKHPTFGWCETKLGPELTEWVIELIRGKQVSPHVFKYRRLESTAKSRSLIKVACECGVFAYVTQNRVDDFALRCGACGFILTPTDDDFTKCFFVTAIKKLYASNRCMAKSRNERGCKRVPRIVAS